MAKELESISIRKAENGAIISIHTTDTDADGDKTWDTEEKVFLDSQKAEMNDFVMAKFTELT